MGVIVTVDANGKVLGAHLDCFGPYDTRRLPTRSAELTFDVTLLTLAAL
jgi:hypothetical protein